MADKYGRTPYQIMLENGATEDELRQRLEGRGTAQSYLDREAQKAAAAAAARPTYNLPSQWFNGMSRMGEAQGWKIDDSNSATWQKIAQLANSGNTQAAIDLANQLSAAGQFGGYYDDQGNYWGFAQGYTGGANASMQPVIGGKILTPKGLEYENTNVWLAPDGKALNYGQGGVLTNNGETWGTTDNRNAQAVGRWYDENGTDSKDARWNTWDAVGARMGWDPAQTYSYMSQSGAFTNPALNTLEGNQQRLAELQANPNADPAAIAETQAYIQKQGGSTSGGSYPSGGSTVYQQVLNNYTPTQPLSYEQWSAQNGGSKPASLSAPGAYDPESDTMWQQYLKDWANKQAPEYAGDPYQAQRDAALAAYGEKWGGSEYQPLRDQYLQNAANMKWDYNPDTDPVWQAYQKQYRREGQRAMEDTLGRVAGMTGGMPSSYAVTAASQAGNYYASQLSDKLPQLYQDAYNRYLQEYQRQLGLSDAYAGFDNTEYQRWLQGQQQNLDLANAYNQYGQIDYSRFMDTVDQFNKDRNFNYGAARDNQALGRQAVEDQYKRYLDALSQANYEDETAYSRYRDTISDQRYDQEWAQQLREYADQQNWKATEWQQYLREYGDKLSQQEKEWAMQQAQQAQDYELTMAKLGAQYGDYSGLSNLGIDTSTANPKEVAYASDGSTYKFNTQDALYFVQNAPNGTAGNPTTMKGSDGSIWRKDEYGNVTITTKNGKTFTYSNSVVPETKNTGTYRYIKDPGDGDTGDTTKDYLAKMKEAGIKTLAGAKAWMAMNGDSKLTKDDRAAIAEAFMESLEQNGDQTAEEDQTADYRNLTESLNWMVQSGRSRDEIYAEINAAVRDDLITKEQGEALKNQYYGQSDNVKNVTLDNGKIKTHSDGLPVSVGYDNAEQTASRMTDSYEIGSYLKRELDAGRIHEYEIAKIVYQASQRGGGYTPGQNWN